MQRARPEFVRLADAVEYWARTQPSSAAYIHHDTTASYVDLEAEIDRLARALLAVGVRRGDRVAMLSTPRPEYWACLIAAASIGAVWVGLNPRYQLNELTHIARDSKPRLLIGINEFEGRDFTSNLEAVARESDAHCAVVCIGGEGDSWGAFLAAGEAVDDAQYKAARDAVTGDEPTVIVYTSGTTGVPKGALLSQSGLCRRFSTSARHVHPRPLRLIANLPINHVGGLGEHGCLPLMAGGTLVFQERFSPEGVLEAIERHRLTVVLQVPTMLKALTEHPRFSTTDWSSVELVIWGGGALPRDVLARFRSRGVTLKTMYGMTETAAAMTFSSDSPEDDVLINSVGRPLPELSLNLRGKDGNPTPDGEVGEVTVDNRGLWLGYFGNPEATAEALTEDGLFRTGDLGRMREDGNLQLVGRLKEMFKSGGYNVYPREVELALEAHPAVRIAAVVGVPDPHFGEVGVGFVEVLDDDRSPERLLTWCRERLASYKVPKKLVVLEAFPLLPNGKVARKVLQQTAGEEYAR